MSFITLEQLLASRDNRSNRQQQLLKQHPDETLLCLTVIIPGSEKRTRESLIIAQAAAAELRKTLNDTVTLWEEHDLQTGFELYILTTLPNLEAKRLTCRIEENHPLGRLFDIDVIEHDGIPVPRSAVGGEERRCLLCNMPARHCMRQRKHTTEELLQHIKNTVNNYHQHS